MYRLYLLSNILPRRLVNSGDQFPEFIGATNILRDVTKYYSDLRNKHRSIRLLNSTEYMRELVHRACRRDVSICIPIVNLIYEVVSSRYDTIFEIFITSDIRSVTTIERGPMEYLEDDTRSVVTYQTLKQYLILIDRWKPERLAPSMFKFRLMELIEEDDPVGIFELHPIPSTLKGNENLGPNTRAWLDHYTNNTATGISNDNIPETLAYIGLQMKKAGKIHLVTIAEKVKLMTDKRVSNIILSALRMNLRMVGLYYNL